jgi:hypothetical protein
MDVMSEFIIPIWSFVASEGLALLVLEHCSDLNLREAECLELAFQKIYRAMFVRYLQRGLQGRDARLMALAEIKVYLSVGSSSGVRALSAGSVQPVHSAQSSSIQLSGAKASIRAYLDANPGARELSINQVLAMLSNRGIRTSRTTVAEVLREFRKSA